MSRKKKKSFIQFLLGAGNKKSKVKKAPKLQSANSEKVVAAVSENVEKNEYIQIKQSELAEIIDFVKSVKQNSVQTQAQENNPESEPEAEPSTELQSVQLDENISDEQDETSDIYNTVQDSSEPADDDTTNEQNENVSNVISLEKKASANQKKQKSTSNFAKIDKADEKAFIKQLKKEKKKLTSQQTIDYKEIFKNGICNVKDNIYTKTLAFEDINYQLAKEDDKLSIFGEYGGLLNYFDETISVQLTFVNQKKQEQNFQNRIPMAGDSNDQYRAEYNQVIKDQANTGKNTMTRKKYLTFGIKADTKDQAYNRIARIETDVRNTFKNFGVLSQPMHGYDKLELMHSIMNHKKDFQFHWDYIYKTGLTTKDFIAPSSFNFSDKKTFLMGDKIASVSYVNILAAELSDNILAEILSVESDMIVNIHLQSIDQQLAIKGIKRKLSDLEKDKIEEQQKAVKNGYDMDILPPDLITYIDEAKELLADLESRDERMFMFTMLILNIADTKENLDNDIFHVSSVCQKYNCQLKSLDYQQEDGFVSSLPLGINKMQIKRQLTTSSVAIFVPFTTQELFQDNGMYYGRNSISGNLILADRKTLKNPNGLILGTPGSGKSFSAKREMADVILRCVNDDVFIIDPEREYSPLINAFGGVVIEISPTSKNYINPMDINLNYSDGDNPIMLKADFILSLCELLIGGKNGLNSIQRTIIDRCVHLTYTKYLQDPRPENIPILEDLYNNIIKQEESEAKNIAIALEIYIKGSLNVFNHHTNIDTQNRLICFDIKDLGNQLKKMGMLIVQDQIWNRISQNRQQGKKTWYYIDEFHLLLKDEQTAQYFVDVWKRARKYGGIPTGITQNVNDLLISREVSNIFGNSDFVYMLNQAADDRRILAEKLNISVQQLSHVTNSNPGEGLFFFGSCIIPFTDHFPTDTKLYSLMTTKIEEIKPNKSA